MLTHLAIRRSFFKGSAPLPSQTPTAIASLNSTERNRRKLYFTTTTTTTTTRQASISNKKKLYLHVGPSGDSWTGDAIFAAKHNQPGYVKSVPLIGEDYNDEGSLLVEILEENPEWAQEIYDTERLPEALLQHLRLVLEEDTN